MDTGKTLDELARTEAEARLAFDCIKMRNTFGLTAEERIALDVEYAIAERAWLSAWTALHRENPIGWVNAGTPPRNFSRLLP